MCRRCPQRRSLFFIAPSPPPVRALAAPSMRPCRARLIVDYNCLRKAAMATQTIQPPSIENPLDAFQWTPQPKAERLVCDLVEEFLRRSPFAAGMRDRM